MNLEQAKLMCNHYQFLVDQKANNSECVIVKVTVAPIGKEDDIVFKFNSGITDLTDEELISIYAEKDYSAIVIVKCGEAYIPEMVSAYKDRKDSI
jgi:hypothetical protein